MTLYRAASAPRILRPATIDRTRVLGPHYIQSQQYQINQPYPSTYFIDALATKGKTLYQQSPLTLTFPVPNTASVPSPPGGLSQGQAPFDPSLVLDSELPTIEPSLEKSDLGLLRTGASGLPMLSNDTRVANATMLPNGVFQITGSTLPYDSFTGDMVHRLFHMWQQSDCDVRNATPNNLSGCLNDLYPFVGAHPTIWPSVIRKTLSSYWREKVRAAQKHISR